MYGVTIFSTKGNWVITAARIRPTEAPIAKPANSSTSVWPRCGAMSGNSVNSAIAISLGLGSTYCGTSKMLSRSSVPPIIDTATRMIASTSLIDLMPGPEVRADMLVIPTSPSAPPLGLEFGDGVDLAHAVLTRRTGWAEVARDG